MINGRGPVKTSTEVSSSDPLDEFFPWQALDGGDASPVSSRYSSCGESEFERYCSANSVMGTPSLCGSVGTFQDGLDSDFGSLKSFRLGNDSAFENLSWKSRYDRKNEDCKVSSSVCVENFESGDRKSELEQRNNLLEGSAGMDNGLDLFDEFTQQKENEEVTKESMFNSQSGIEFDRGGSDEGETSSRYEHSEGEDSMFGCGTDDEKHIDVYEKRKIEYPGEANDNNGISLGMNSSIAFGSDDWDDFMQEQEENALFSMSAGELQVQKQKSVECEDDQLSSTFLTTTLLPSTCVAQEVAKDDSLANKQVQGADELAVYNSLRNCTNLMEFGDAEQVESVKNMLVATNQVETNSVSNIRETGQDSITEIAPLKEKFNISNGGSVKEHEYTKIEEVSGFDDSHISESAELEKTKLQLDPLSDISVEATEDRSAKFHKDSKAYALRPLVDNDIKRKLDSPASSNLFEEPPTPVKTENLELNGFYDDLVHEMEEILLDSGGSPGARFSQGNRTFQYHVPPPLRDGGSTASTSGTDDAFQQIQIQHPMIIDWVEVVGARQKKGDVSFSERLVGVKEYTVYQIRVRSGKDHWEVERRYRDFCTLYRRLKTLFTDYGWVLPSPWSSVERESRKIFGNVSPDVIAERSVLIQECLRSVLQSRSLSNTPGALIWFLSRSKAESSSSASDTHLPQSPFFTRSTDRENVSTFGNTISLVVEIQPYKSTKQMLESQHYTCAGCHKHFDDGKTRMLELVQTLGWGKPRLCAYSGQLFCSSCHTNDTAVLPARVLHFWDFTQYPISQLAKSYLDSIHDQPMLCVSAVNPFLFSKVPALQHVTNVRKRIGAMLPYVRCPFRRTIYKGLGSRRYLLESNDFFALRDLIDLSKGVFAALPVMVETVSRKILEHITEQCLICYDAGVPCNARQACEDPSALIFPFQEGEVERCRSCELVFHKPCFKKLVSCPCGMHLKLDKTEANRTKGGLVVGSEADGTLDLLRRKEDSSSTLGLLSGLFSKAMPERLRGAKDSDTVILMGSLPSTSL